MKLELQEKIKAIVDKAEGFDLAEFAKTYIKFYRYSFHNIFLLYAQAKARGIQIGQVAGYRKWTELNRQVTKGEKGLMILVPYFYSKKELDTEEDEKTLRGFGVGYVFDISQTTGAALPHNDTITMARNSEDLYTELYKKINSHYPITCKPMEYSKGGYTDGETIYISTLHNKEKNCVTLLHELAHCTMEHKNEVDEIERGQMECEAAVLTKLIAEYYSIEYDTSAYLKAWKCKLAELQRFSKGLSRMKKILELE